MQELLGFSTYSKKIGFRLARLEILNWGTFDKKIWKILPNGQNSLLTGDIGSGKSTLVDAITTLLVPHQRITYNKAAGAEGKERNLKTYILGEYKNEKNEQGGATPLPVYLRTEKNHSVILGHFMNEGLAREVTLAQIFWLNSSGKVDKFFVYSPISLSIEEHFTKFGSSMIDLKKKLRAIDKLLVTDDFKEYGIKFRQEFGIQNEKALDLFYQTVSMKSVGKLTDFVRSQMLERTDVKEKIENLKKYYDDLNKAYGAVKKAKDQLDELTPLVEEIDAWEMSEEDTKELDFLKTLLPAYFAEKQIDFLITDLANWATEILILASEQKEIENDLEKHRQEKSQLSASIEQDPVGRRLKELAANIDTSQKSKSTKEKKYNAYRTLCDKIELTSENKREIFYQTNSLLQDLENKFAAEKKNCEDVKSELEFHVRTIREKCEEREVEIKSLKERKSLIPNNNLGIRREIAKTLDIDESDIPFIGEILQVKETERKWTGAIERLLYSFGLSILVSEKYYNEFSSYVNSNNLKGKIIFYKTVTNKSNANSYKQSVATKLEIKSDREEYVWLDAEIKNRFGDYICCNSLEEFKNLGKAVTIEGLVKHGQNKHEKDDRANISDSSRYILGWSNQEKIEALEKELDVFILQWQKAKKEIENSKKNLEEIEDRIKTIWDLKRFEDFTELNWQDEAIHLQDLLEEKLNLEKSSDQLRELNEKLTQLELMIKEKSGAKDNVTGQLAILKKSSENAKVKKQEKRSVFESIAIEDKEACFPLLKRKVNQSIKLTNENIEAIERLTEKEIESDLKLIDKKQKKIRDSIIRKMKNYSDKYKEETSDVDSSIESRSEYKLFLKKIEEEDLPKYAARFKNELKENTIQNILTFKNELESSANDIESKINEINKSLKEIEYNSGTYIQIVAEKTDSADIRDFKEMLRNSLVRVDSEEETYSEKIFFQVKQIIDRFNSAEVSDINWTARVTDVKNWFEFIVDENYLATNAHKERYADSGGKSGGQKEKLAYTILASALSYQFGLKFDSRDDRSFRFVVIDEAFGRGSDESTRYGLNLFNKLNLQILIVTPMQKINIIEDYVNTVHFVSNTKGDNSVVTDLAIEAYKIKKKEFQT